MLTPPTGAGAEICKLIFWVPASITDIAAGEKLESTVTSATLISGAKPVAVPVICTDPINMPVICGFAAGTCNPSGINTLDVTVAMRRQKWLLMGMLAHWRLRGSMVDWWAILLALIDL